MENGEVFEADARGNLIVEYAVKNGGERAHRDDAEGFHVTGPYEHTDR
jgi:hypothetical protein